MFILCALQIVSLSFKPFNHLNDYYSKLYIIKALSSGYHPHEKFYSLIGLTYFFRSRRPEVFLRRALLKICSKFAGEHRCRNVVSIKLQSNFIEITLRHGSYPVNLVHFIRTTFPKNTSGGLFLMLQSVLFLASYRVQEQSPGGDL